MNSGQAIAFGQQGQTFQDRRLRVMPTIEDGPDRFDKGAVTGATLIALGPSLRATKPADVALIDFTIISTVWIPAECAGMHKICLFHCRPSACWCSVMIHQHEEGRLPINKIADRLTAGCAAERLAKEVENLLASLPARPSVERLNETKLELQRQFH